MTQPDGLVDPAYWNGMTVRQLELDTIRAFLEQHRSRFGRRVLDYGCGSGVLAIAALKLGCESASAMDIDPQAVIATQQNAAHNRVGRNLEVSGSPDGLEGR